MIVLVPATKMLITIKTSWNSPASSVSSAMPSASAPADNVPKARLNPLLSVAPEKSKLSPTSSTEFAKTTDHQPQQN